MICSRAYGARIGGTRVLETLREICIVVPLSGRRFSRALFTIVMSWAEEARGRSRIHHHAEQSKTRKQIAREGSLFLKKTFILARLYVESSVVTSSRQTTMDPPIAQRQDGVGSPLVPLFALAAALVKAILYLLNVVRLLVAFLTITIPT